MLMTLVEFDSGFGYLISEGTTWNLKGVSSSRLEDQAVGAIKTLHCSPTSIGLGVDTVIKMIDFRRSA